MYMIDGILLIDKEEGITSYDVIRKLKKILGRDQKIGHTGTLDPFATGLLIVLLGKGTKLMESFHGLDKRYLVEGKMGIATDTQDITGEVIQENDDTIPTLENIQTIIRDNFLGEISQTPPIYSAKRVNGKRSYDMARAGEKVDLKPKVIKVKEFNVVNYSYPTISCEILCSTGTYVRTLINDLGVKLGCFATASQLRRLSIGQFNVKDSLKVSVLEESDIDESVKEISKVIDTVNNGKR